MDRLGDREVFRGHVGLRNGKARLLESGGHYRARYQVCKKCKRFRRMSGSSKAGPGLGDGFR